MYCRNCGNEMNSEAVVCVKCGAPKGKGNTFCSNCGATVGPNAEFCMNCGASFKKAIPNNITKRNIVVAIILSLVTCGIYEIYWFVKLTDEINALTGNEKDTSGGIAFLLTLVTCGIYGFYWAYKMGQKRDTLDEGSNSSAVLYLVLMLLGVGFIDYILLQDAINKTVEGR